MHNYNYHPAAVTSNFVGAVQYQQYDTCIYLHKLGNQSVEFRYG